MSERPAAALAAGGAEAHIPPPPPVPVRRRRRRNHRPLLWTIALLCGIAVGVAGYQLVPGVDRACEYWLALLLG